MKSIRDIYKIGKGPSSSHTMGPERAAKLFWERYPDADTFQVILYGSLSKTGVGHGTDRVIREVLSPREEQIILLRYGIGGRKPLPQREVANRLGISRSYVSRIEKGALEKLQNAFG